MAACSCWAPIIGWSILTRLPRDPVWFGAGVIGTALAVAATGALLEATLLRRLYHAPELFQLLATFGVLLVIQDLTVLLGARTTCRFLGRPGCGRT